MGLNLSQNADVSPLKTCNNYEYNKGDNNLFQPSRNSEALKVTMGLAELKCVTIMFVGVGFKEGALQSFIGPCLY